DLSVRARVPISLTVGKRVYNVDIYYAVSVGPNPTDETLQYQAGPGKSDWRLNRLTTIQDFEVSLYCRFPLSTQWYDWKEKSKCAGLRVAAVTILKIAAMTGVQ